MDPIETKSAAMIIQDLQNDVIIEGGAFADSGAPAHATSQNVVANVKGLAEAARKAGVPVIHVWYVVEPGAAGLKQNAPLFEASRIRTPSSAAAGAPLLQKASSRRTATTSSRRCG